MHLPGVLNKIEPFLRNRGNLAFRFRKFRQFDENQFNIIAVLNQMFLFPQFPVGDDRRQVSKHDEIGNRQSDNRL